MSVFYNGLKQMGPNVTEHTELADYMTQLFQIRADHTRTTGRGLDLAAS